MSPAFLFLFVVAVDQFLGGLARVATRVGSVRVLLSLLLRPTLATVSAPGRVFISVVVILVVLVGLVPLPERHSA